MSVTTVITDGGFTLLRAAPGNRLVYTRACCGSGHVDKVQLAQQTEIEGYEMDLSIVEIRPTKDVALVRLQLDNSKANHEFQLYQIGLFAKLLNADGEEVIGETLVQIMQYEQPDIVRAVPHVSEFVVNTIIGQAADVSGIIDLAAYVSIRQFRLALDDLVRSIMMNEVSLPLKTAAGEKLLTSGGIPIEARYRLERSGSVMAAVAALEDRLTEQISQTAANTRAYADGTGQTAVSQARAYTGGQLVAHNTADTAHPTHLAVVTT